MFGYLVNLGGNPAGQLGDLPRGGLVSFLLFLGEFRGLAAFPTVIPRVCFGAAPAWTLTEYTWVKAGTGLTAPPPVRGTIRGGQIKSNFLKILWPRQSVGPLGGNLGPAAYPPHVSG